MREHVVVKITHNAQWHCPGALKDATASSVRPPTSPATRIYGQQPATRGFGFYASPRLRQLHPPLPAPAKPLSMGMVGTGKAVDMVGRLGEPGTEAVDEALQALEQRLVTRVQGGQALARSLGLFGEGR
jgi:hypothetical protein